jgi:hypothetical protein
MARLANQPGAPGNRRARLSGETKRAYNTSSPIVAMKTKVILVVALLGTAAAGRAFASAPAATPAESRVSVIPVDPQKFTDAKRSSWGDYSPELVAELQTFMQKTGENYVPAGMHLEIRITDIDLAGDFEPQRGPKFDDVRIVKSVYPPRIHLQFKLTDAKGNVVSSGDRRLTDLAFENRTAWPADDYLRYEKEIVRDWFRQEFRGLKQG